MVLQNNDQFNQEVGNFSKLRRSPRFLFNYINFEFEFEWGFYALSASKATLRARTYNHHITYIKDPLSAVGMNDNVPQITLEEGLQVPMPPLGFTVASKQDIKDASPVFTSTCIHTHCF